jgi:sigma-B regulation protein RsbU (phosphoserine phosphatase)
LGGKLGLVATLGAGLVFGLASFHTYRVSRAAVLADAEEDAKNLCQLVLARVETAFGNVESPVRFFAMDRNPTKLLPAETGLMLTNSLRSNTNIIGAGIFYEPYAYNPTGRWYGMYIYRTNGIEYLQDESYNYHLKDWYIVPKELNAEYWSEPYYDEGGVNTMICSFARPLHYVHGRLPVAAVFEADVSLEWLHDMVQSASLITNGYCFIISGTGKFVTHPNPDFRREESIFSLAEEAGDPALRRIGKKMVRGATGREPITSLHTGKPAWLFYAPMRLRGWSFGVVIPEDILFADIRALLRKQVFSVVIGLVGLFAVVLLITTLMTRPLRVLSEKSAAMARGNLDIDLPASRGADEIGDLSRAFEEMRRALKEYIANLERTTAAKQKIESELNIARTIQMTFIPKIFPAFPERKDFDLFATLEPAREVGGDLYNFCLSDGERLHFCVGDVSDKGVPAALVMAVTQTLVKAVSRRPGITPDEILAEVNREFSKENEQCMFITMFCAAYSFKTGDLVFSNAGHNPPVIVRAGGKVEWLALPPGIVLGVDPAAIFQKSSVQLAPGDMIIAYTDGVTEAMNPSRELYSEKRLEETAAGCKNRTPREAVEIIMKSVKAHAGTEPQSDDITVLGMKILA